MKQKIKGFLIAIAIVLVLGIQESAGELLAGLI